MGPLHGTSPRKFFFAADDRGRLVAIFAGCISKQMPVPVESFARQRSKVLSIHLSMTPNHAFSRSFYAATLVLLTPLFSCSSGGGGGGGDDQDLEAVTIRGMLDDALLSTALPSSTLPSTFLAATSLPGMDTEVFTAPIDSQQVVALPLSGFNSGSSTGSGTAELTLDTATLGLTGTVTIEALENPDNQLLTVQLYTGFAGENGPGFLNLEVDPGDSNVFTVPAGTMLTSDQVDDMQAANVYVSVEFDAVPVLRGQIASSTSRVARVELQARQVIPAVGTVNTEPVGGVGYLTFNPSDELQTVVANLAVFGFSASEVNLHSDGAAGLVGPVDLNLLDISSDGTNFSIDGLASNDLASLMAGTSYFSAESSANPDGEIRGQVMPENMEAVQVIMTENQVIGTPSIEGGSATAFFTFETDNANGMGNGSFDGMESSNNPIVVVIPDGFTASAVRVVAGSAFAGMVGTNERITLNDDDVAGIFVANTPDTLEEDLQSIANLSVLLNGGYYIEAVEEVTLNQIRGQITPGSIQVMQFTLDGAQVVEGTPISGGSALASFTFDSSNSIGAGDGSADGDLDSNNPVVVVTPTGFTASDVRVIVGGGFAGLVGSAQRIILEDSNSNGTFVANMSPQTMEEDLQSIASLAGLLNGVYYIEAIEAGTGNEIRGQILPPGTAALRADISGAETIPVDPDVVGGGVGNITITNLDAGTFVANARFNFVPDSVSVNIGGNMNTLFIPLTQDSDPTLFTSGAPQAAANVNGILGGNYSIEAQFEQ